MHKGEEIPLVNKNALLSDALVEMSSKSLGMTGIVDENKVLLGIYTDGDLRRTLSERISIDTPISDVMTVNPTTAEPDMLAAELISNMQDLLRAGIL